MSKLLKNQKKLENKQKDLSKARDEKCNPLAKRLLVLMAESKISGEIAGHSHKDYFEVYKSVYVKFVEEAMEADLTIADISYTISITKSFTELFQQMSDSSMEENVKIVEKKVYNGKEMINLTLKEIDEIMKGTVDKK